MLVYHSCVLCHLLLLFQQNLLRAGSTAKEIQRTILLPGHPYVGDGMTNNTTGKVVTAIGKNTVGHLTPFS